MRSSAKKGSVASRNGRGSRDRLDLDRLLTVLMAVKKGDLSARLPDNKVGTAGKIADTLNDLIELNQKLAGELHRLSNVVGKEGRIAQRATIGGDRKSTRLNSSH